jgi:hypothetical protein
VPVEEPSTASLADSCFALVHRRLEIGVFDPNADIAVIHNHFTASRTGNSGQSTNVDKQNPKFERSKSKVEESPRPKHRRLSIFVIAP